MSNARRERRLVQLAERKRHKQERKTRVNQIPNNRVPILGQQQAAEQAMVMQLYHAAFLGVLPAVVQVRLAGPQYADDPPIAERIALEADRIAVAAMKRLGVTINKGDL